MAAGNVIFVGSHVTNASREVYTFRSLSTRPAAKIPTPTFSLKIGSSYLLKPIEVFI
jgi:hypothetical protein